MEVKINEQNKTIATGPLYVYTEFEAILLEDMVVLNPVGYRTSLPHLCKTPNYIFVFRNDVIK